MTDIRIWAPHTMVMKKYEIKKLLEHKKYLNGEILDIGCGDRPYEELFNHNKYVGIDINKDSKADVICDATALPFKESSFDSIISIQALQYVKDYQEAVNEMSRVLKRDGTLLLIIPQSFREDVENPDYHRFTREGIKLILNEAQLRCKKIEPLGGLFFSFGYELSFFLHDKVIDSPKILRYILAPLLIIIQYLSSVLDFIDTEKKAAVHFFIMAQKT